VTRPIIFLSDYGLDDEFVGICHGVIARLAPDTHVIDLSHGIPRADVRAGALRLAAARPYMPPDSVYLAVVDPGVGTARRAIAVEDPDGFHGVGPDNGLLSQLWTGPPARAVEITSEEVVLRPASATFHGRDVFAPAAAHLALERPILELGPQIPVESLVRIEVPRAVVGERVSCEVLSVDRFGNVQLAARPEDDPALERASRVVVARGGREWAVARARTFGEVAQGEPLLIVDSSGRLSLTVNGGSAAEAFGLRPGDRVELRPAGGGLTREATSGSPDR